MALFLFFPRIMAVLYIAVKVKEQIYVVITKNE